MKTTTTDYAQQRLLAEIEEALRRTIQGQAEALIAEAKADLERRVRQEVGKIAVSLCSQYHVERIRDELIITVKINGEPR